MTDSWFDNNVLQRITSANRAGCQPRTSTQTTSPLSKKQYLTVGGTANSQDISMKAMPKADGSEDMGMAWFFRYPSNDSPQNYWTIHNARTGAGMCLERMDTTKGTLQMTPLTKGRPKSSQIWYITQPDFPSPYGNLYSVIDQPRPDGAPLGGKKPVKLDVLTGTDKAAAMRIDGSPFNAQGDPFVEGTKWKIDSVRGMNDQDEQGYGWSPGPRL